MDKAGAGLSDRGYAGSPIDVDVTPGRVNEVLKARKVPGSKQAADKIM